MDQILDCVPNFSEGRRKEVVEAIADCFRRTPGVKLLDYSMDPDHNRSVITAAGEPEGVKKAAVEAAGRAAALIDLRKHSGKHPRIGAMDVLPFIPIKGIDMDGADKIAKEAGKEIGSRFGVPVFLYDYSASMENRVNLADIRKGQFEGLEEKMKDRALWKPDFGPEKPHPQAGASAVGARFPLIAYNVLLNTSDVAVAKKIAGKIRERDGGLPGVKALGIFLEQRGLAQVSMNLVDYRKTGIFEAFSAVKREAENLGASVLESELIGLLPLDAAAGCIRAALKFPEFSASQILEEGI